MLQKSIIFLFLLIKILLIGLVLWYSYYILPSFFKITLVKVLLKTKLSRTETWHFIFTLCIIFVNAISLFNLFTFFLESNQIIFFLELIKLFLIEFILLCSYCIFIYFFKKLILKFWYKENFFIIKICNYFIFFVLVYIIAWGWLIILNDILSYF